MYANVPIDNDVYKCIVIQRCVEVYRSRMVYTVVLLYNCVFLTMFPNICTHRSLKHLLPVVWSFDGPVLEVLVGPFCNVQSKSSDFTWLQAQRSMSKLHVTVFGPLTEIISFLAAIDYLVEKLFDKHL